MKRTMAKTCILLLMISVLCLSVWGCKSRLYDTSSMEAEAMLETLLAAIESGQAQAVKELFSKQAQQTAPDLNHNLSALFEFYDGEMTSYQRYGPGTSASREGSAYQEEIFCSFDVTTTTGDFRIALLFVTADSESPDRVGLRSVYIIRAEDSDPDRAYWGIDNENDIWKPGINIE